MRPHHEESIRNLVALFSAQPDVLAVILGGSIAQGKERPASDIDAMVLLDGDSLTDRPNPRPRAEAIQGRCTYPEGYFDIKYYTRDFLEAAADHGSEPARNAFLGAKVLFSRDSGIEALVDRIPVYPESLRAEKIRSFLGGLLLNSYYFWEEADRLGDPYLKSRTATDIALYGLRLLLAHNRVLFPSHKRLLETAEGVAEKPEGILSACRAMLADPTRERKDAFVLPILQFSDWGIDLRAEYPGLMSRYIDDNELWWYLQRPNVVEW